VSLLADLLSWTALLAGGALVLIGGVGLLRLPDFFTRLHAASLTDTLGAAFIAIGLALQAGPGIVAVKLALTVLFLLLTGPVATHALAKAALHGSVRPVDASGREIEIPEGTEEPAS
jgi:multicomponent Na+:H+ antiporter subunit G